MENGSGIDLEHLKLIEQLRLIEQQKQQKQQELLLKQQRLELEQLEQELLQLEQEQLQLQPERALELALERERMWTQEWTRDEGDEDWEDGGSDCLGLEYILAQGFNSPNNWQHRLSIDAALADPAYKSMLYSLEPDRRHQLACNVWRHCTQNCQSPVVKREYARLLPFIAPITRLPLELLRHILLIAIDDGTQSPLALINVSLFLCYALKHSRSLQNATNLRSWNVFCKLSQLRRKINSI
jgi:hypothetical protein